MLLCSQEPRDDGQKSLPLTSKQFFTSVRFSALIAEAPVTGELEGTYKERGRAVMNFQGVPSSPNSARAYLPPNRMPATILLAKTARKELRLSPEMANRHGLIAGATGTGKTVTLQALAEGFSDLGVPVFMADVKGDLAGLSQSGRTSGKVEECLRQLGIKDRGAASYPVTFWDIFGELGHPVRATISEMGPILLSRLLQLNDIQSGVLNLAFRIADEHGLLLLDLKDLRAVLKFVGENASAFTSEYGNISAASIGAIQRSLLVLDTEGAAKFFGEPALNLDDMIQTDSTGRGIINILSAERLMRAPKVYATALLWLLSELLERLPEVGDLPKPKLVFFFDEAHLLFTDIPNPLLEKVVQVVRLIRSKGVGVYFVTQNPRDIPDQVLGQLGNRVQHALRAFTPADQKTVRAAVDTFRTNPKLDTAAEITQLGVGEALISLLDLEGQPSMVERALVVPPRSRIGSVTGSERQKVIAESLVAGVYEKEIDRESAYERLVGAHAARSGATTDGSSDSKPVPKGFFASLFGDLTAPPEPEPPTPQLPKVERHQGRQGRPEDDLGKIIAKTAVRTLTTAVVGTVSREILRGLLGGSRRR